MTWITATVRALMIFAYFVVATVWLPDFVLGLGSVAEAAAVVRDGVALVVWGGAFFTGMWLLRRAQLRGLI